MLIHIVCWKYKAETSDEDIIRHRSELAALAGIIPEVISLRVGADVLHLERSFDTGLTSEFADREALDAYSNHPEHLKVAAFGREIAERAVSVDFIV